MTVVEPSDNMKLAMASPNYMKKKILCRVWSHEEGNTPRLIATKKVGYGEPDFTISLGGKGFLGKKHKRRYMIIYEPKIGGLKQGKNCFEYDVNFEHSNEPLSFNKFKEQKMVDSKQAESMLVDGAVDFFINKGGIPMWYLLLAIMGLVIVGGLCGILGTQYAQLNDNFNQAVKLYQVDEAKISALNAQLKANGIQCPVGAVCSRP